MHKMEQADIIVFLFSPDFIASEECTNEWNHALNLASSGKPLFRIPIIVRECSWKDVLGNDDVKALPVDGKPVALFEDKDIAWHQVYEGIREVVDELRMTFAPKMEFLKELEKTDFISQSHLRLQDLFVFPRMTIVDEITSEQPTQPRMVVNHTQLLDIKY